VKNQFDRKTEEMLEAYAAGTLELAKKKAAEELLERSPSHRQYVGFLKMAGKRMREDLWTAVPPTLKRNILFEVTRPAHPSDLRQAAWLTAAFVCLLAGIFIGRQWFSQSLIIVMPNGLVEPGIQRGSLEMMDKDEQEGLIKSLRKIQKQNQSHLSSEPQQQKI
jgi:hypothetical protein